MLPLLPTMARTTAGGGSVVRDLVVGLGRAAGASLLFSIPMLMTMEMWFLGVHMDRFRLALFLILTIPLLSALSYFSGFEEVDNLAAQVADAFVAYLVGLATALALLYLLGTLTPAMRPVEIVGKATLQAIPASMGAALARTQLGGSIDANLKRREPGYFGELFLMAAGALFIAFNIAPTEEVLVIAFRMDAWQSLVLVVLALAIIHGFVYALEFRGGSEIPEGSTIQRAFLQFSVTGYAIALGVSAYVLWSFGRFSGMGYAEAVMITVVLALPASLGAAAGRLIL